MRILRRTALALAAALAVALAVLLSMTELPSATPDPVPSDDAPYAARGLFGVGIRELDLPSGSARTLVWYPAEAEPAPSTSYPYAISIAGMLGATTVGTSIGRAVSDAPPDGGAGNRPLVVLEPGYGIGPRAYAWLGEHLASHGFVVTAFSRGGSLAGAMDGLWRSAVTRPRGLRASLHDLDTWARGDDPVAALVDAESVAVVGHSYGGYTALVAGGARIDTRGFVDRCATVAGTDQPGAFLCDALEPHVADMAMLAELPAIPDGLWPDWSEPTVDAVVSLAGDAYLFDRTGLAELDVPVLAIGGTADADTPYAWGTEPTFAHASAPRRARATLEDAEHMVFTARCTTARRLLTLVPFGFCDDADGKRVQRQQVIAHLTTAFLLAELEDDPDAARALAPDHGDLPATTYTAVGY